MLQKILFMQIPFEICGKCRTGCRSWWCGCQWRGPRRQAQGCRRSPDRQQVTVFELRKLVPSEEIVTNMINLRYISLDIYHYHDDHHHRFDDDHHYTQRQWEGHLSNPQLQPS